MTSTAASDARLASRGGRLQPALFLGGSALLFVASAALTIAMSTSMAAMHAMPMPGGWTMSMMWMRMPGETWAATWTSFLVTWDAMMAAMMLPSLVPALCRCRQTIASARDERRLAIAATGYFVVWTAFGLIAFPAGAILAALAMRWSSVARLVPVAGALIIVVAGAVQFTRWKAHHLARFHDSSAPCCASSRDAKSNWRYGVRLGLRCARCCANLMAILCVVGMMDVRAMAMVTVAITAERLSTAGPRAAHVIGAVVLAVGMVLLVRAAL